MTSSRATHRLAAGILLTSAFLVALGSTPAHAALPTDPGESWQLLAAADSASVLTPTAHNVTTAANDTEWYYNADEATGFAPAGATISQGTADTSAWGGTADATTDYRLSWHTYSGRLQPGWRAGGTVDLNYDPFVRAIYTADVLPAYYPSGVQLGVPRGALTGWTLCYSGPYSGSLPLVDLWAACDGAYLLYAAGSAGTPGELQVRVGGTSILDAPGGDQTGAAVAGSTVTLTAVTVDTTIPWSDYRVYTSVCSGVDCTTDTPAGDPAQWDAGVPSTGTFAIPASAVGRQLWIAIVDDATAADDLASAVTLTVSAAPAVLAATGSTVPWIPLTIGGVVLLAGVALLLFGRRRIS